jgi:hypothetical protein
VARLAVGPELARRVGAHVEAVTDAVGCEAHFEEANDVFAVSGHVIVAGRASRVRKEETDLAVRMVGRQRNQNKTRR